MNLSNEVILWNTHAHTKCCRTKTTHSLWAECARFEGRRHSDDRGTRSERSHRRFCILATTNIFQSHTTFRHAYRKRLDTSHRLIRGVIHLQLETKTKDKKCQNGTDSVYVTYCWICGAAHLVPPLLRAPNLELWHLYFLVRKKMETTNRVRWNLTKMRKVFLI